MASTFHPIPGWLRRVFVAGGCCLASACATGPEHAGIQPLDVIDVPAAWSGSEPAGSAATPLDRWWTRFDDAQLSALVAQALATNTSIATARANVLQSRALRDLAATALWPTLGGTASVRQGRAGGQGTGRVIDLGLGANWVPDVFGGNRHALDAASAAVEASLADAGASALAVASEVALAYILLREGQARLAIAGDNLVNQEDTLQISGWREQAGLATALDTAQARTAVEQTRALLPPFATSIAQTRHALAVLTGRPPAALQSMPVAVQGIPHGSAPLNLDIPADTLRQRPDVRAAGHRVSAALSRVSQAEAARFPVFALAGSLGLSAAGAGALFRSSAALSSVTASATAPLFDGGAARAEIRVQQAALEQSRVAYQAVVLTALREVEDALRALAGDRDRMVSLEAAADAAGQAAQMSRQRFAGGLIDFQVVLQTQRTLLVTQDSLAVATADVSSDQVRLCVALGGGWREGPAPQGSSSPEQAGWVWSQ